MRLILTTVVKKNLNETGFNKGQVIQKAMTTFLESREGGKE